MKKKNFNKKLELNKETVSSLNRNEMINAKGGTHPTVLTIFVEGHEASFWACDFTHGGDDGEPMNSLEQGCTTDYNA